MDAWWWEGAGSTCTPFSRFGSRSGWLDWATLIYLVWVFSTRFFEPDSGIHECVVAFPSSSLAAILDGEGAGAMKSPYARPAPDHCDPGYHIESVAFSPVDIGIPSHRPRRYTSFHLRQAITADDECASFEDLFFRRLCASPDIYLVASQEMQDTEMRDWLSKLTQTQRLRRAIGDECTSCIDIVLQISDHSRLEGWMLGAQK